LNATVTPTRDRIVAYLRRQLIGPESADEVLRDAPSYRYTMAVLYPREVMSDIVTAEEDLDESGGGVGEELTDDPVTLANQYLPSSVGISFFIEGDDATLGCDVWGAAYEAVGTRKDGWRRGADAVDEAAPETVELSTDRPSADVLGDRAVLVSNWRQLPRGHLVTVTLVNAAEAETRHLSDSHGCLFQVGFRCSALRGRITEYPSVGWLALGEEDEELHLLYRRARAYAVGHGCSARWAGEHDGTVESVRTEFMPTVDVPPLVQRAGSADVLSLARLSAPSSPPPIAELREFVAGYEAWIASLPDHHRDIPEQLHGARDRILDRLRAAARRMNEGIDLLERDADVLTAFRVANLAMLMQMEHASEALGGRTRQRGETLELPLESDYMAADNRRWYPFQLAYILLTLPSVCDPASDDRDVVDLLWFPTGGGKTEAYLAVAAVAIVLRRLRDPEDGGGTTVITRYTLRLLTAQQFQRAATLVCALEHLRRTSQVPLGRHEVSIGLWVGEDTPRHFKDAVERRDDVVDQDFPENPFQLERCSWCGTAIIPERRSEDRAAYGITATNTSFAFHCPSDQCPFHDRLPIQVVDDALYADPPTVLIGTVDKFARMAWLDEPGVFFGSTGNAPPWLIIQDEMHLLAGPLGTTVGIYESAIEALCSLGGARPKILASTATIRDAGNQAQSLFGRHVRLFPPAGLEAGDSYYSQVDRDATGRLYVGVMAPSHTPSTSIVRSSAVLCQAVIEERLSEDEIDGYWTQVVYHNSLRELGKTVTFARDDIPAWIDVIATDQARRRRLDDENVLELTSNVSSPDIPRSLSRLFLRWDEPEHVALLACTNMLSVGVDVPRLGLMLVNGQPKTTSEYIQASSRVGRKRDVPGLVVTHFAATKPRDRSHYESFIPYHSALYRWVEPTSVTPFSLPSRSRALHAALVVLVRHGAGLPANSDARLFRRNDPRIEAVIEALIERARLADPDEADATAEHVARLAEEWEALAFEGDREQHALHYSARGPHRSLLRDFGARGEGWETLHSMRNVDRQCELQVMGVRQ
jgi:hypothetical protein